MRFSSRTIPRLLVSGLVTLIVALLAHRELTTGGLSSAEYEQARPDEKEGEYQNTLEQLEKAVHSSPGDVGYSHRYSVALFRASRLEEAEAIAKENFPKLVELARVAPGTHLQSLLENRILVGDIGKSRGNVKDAEKAYEEAYGLYEKLSGSERQSRLPQFVSLAESLAGVYQLEAEAAENRGSPDDANAYWDKAAKLYGEARDLYWKLPSSERQQWHVRFVRLSGALAGVHEARAEGRQAAGVRAEAEGHWVEAERLYGEGLDLYRKVSPSEQQEQYEVFAGLYRGLAEVHHAMGRTERAQEVLIEARDKLWRLVKQDQSKFSPMLAAVLTDLARFALAQKQIQAAQGFSEDSITVCQRLLRTEPKRSPSILLACLPTSAAVYEAQGRWAQAQETYDEARRVYWKLPADERNIHRPLMLSILESLSTLQSAQGNRSAQLETLQEGCDLGWKLVRDGQQKHGPVMARMLGQMAILAEMSKDPDAAQQYSDDAAWIYRALYRSNRDVYGDGLALALLGGSAVRAGKRTGAVCELLNEASVAARSADVQYRISQARIKASCPRETAVNTR